MWRPAIAMRRSERFVWNRDAKWRPPSNCTKHKSHRRIESAHRRHARVSPEPMDRRFCLVEPFHTLDLHSSFPLQLSQPGGYSAVKEDNEARQLSKEIDMAKHLLLSAAAIFWLSCAAVQHLPSPNHQNRPIRQLMSVECSSPRPTGTCRSRARPTTLVRDHRSMWTWRFQRLGARAALFGSLLRRPVGLPSTTCARGAPNRPVGICRPCPPGICSKRAWSSRRTPDRCEPASQRRLA